jgi:hypothetical protein
MAITDPPANLGPRSFYCASSEAYIDPDADARDEWNSLIEKARSSLGQPIMNADRGVGINHSAQSLALGIAQQYIDTSDPLRRTMSKNCPELRDLDHLIATAIARVAAGEPGLSPAIDPVLGHLQEAMAAMLSDSAADYNQMAISSR